MVDPVTYLMELNLSALDWEVSARLIMNGFCGS